MKNLLIYSLACIQTCMTFFHLWNTEKRMQIIYLQIIRLGICTAFMILLWCFFLFFHYYYWKQWALRCSAFPHLCSTEERNSTQIMTDYSFNVFCLQMLVTFSWESLLRNIATITKAMQPNTGIQDQYCCSLAESILIFPVLIILSSPSN